MSINYDYLSHMPYKLWLNLRGNSNSDVVWSSYLLYSLIQHRFGLSCQLSRDHRDVSEQQNLIL